MRPAALVVEFLHEMLACVHARRMRRDLREAVRLVDATQLNPGLRLQRWLGLHRGQAAAKLHAAYDPRAECAVFFALTPVRVNDITAAKQALPIEPGATYVFDRGYYEFGWWAELDRLGCRFVTRLKSNTPLHDTEARALAPGGGVLADRTGHLPERLARSRRNPFAKLGREVVVRTDAGKTGTQRARALETWLRLFTNDLASSAETIAALYKERWQIELFFKWIKQNHLRIHRFLGTSENAVRSQIATALIAYLLVRLAPAGRRIQQAAMIVPTIIRTHLFGRRPLPDLLHPPPRTKPPPSPQLSFLPYKP